MNTWHWAAIAAAIVIEIPIIWWLRQSYHRLLTKPNQDVRGIPELSARHALVSAIAATIPIGLMEAGGGFPKTIDAVFAGLLGWVCYTLVTLIVPLGLATRGSDKWVVDIQKPD